MRNMVFDMGSIFTYLLGLFLVYICCWLFLKPIKWILRLLVSCLIGCLFMMAINYMGGFVNVHLAINPLSAMVTGVLGVPGVVLLLFLQGML